VSGIRQAFRSFAGEQPGRRFIHHYERTQRGDSLATRILRVGLGLTLTIVGVLLWFLPGPGWLLVAFGMALLAGESRYLAQGLDRLEVLLRSTWRRVQLRWRSA
jgi:hypothetical protein